MDFTVSDPFVTERVIKLPFTINSLGRVADSTDYKQIWDYRVRSVIGTNLGERLFRADFGMRVRSLSFATISLAKEIVTKEVEGAFSAHLPSLTLDEINVSFNEPLDRLEVEILYTLPDNTTNNTAVGAFTISGNTPIN